MVLAFALFAGIVLLILWLFQTVWLDDIYCSLKLRDLDRCADEIVCCAETADGFDRSESLESFEEQTGAFAAKYGVCISAYRIRGFRGEFLFDHHVSALCFIHSVGSERLLNQLYREAREHDGEYTERVSLAAMFGGAHGDGLRDSDEGENVIEARVIRVGDADMFLLCNTELAPLESTVKTLRIQLTVISAVLLLVAVALAFLLSDRISKPIRDMSREADKLALGDYNVNFDGGNCTETANLSGTLNRAAYELSKLDKMQKDLIANVSHDLRTPLTMIAGYTEAMRDLPGEATPENMQIVIDETNRLTSLVSDMLEVSRYQGGTQTLKCTRFNFTAVIRTTLERYAKLREHDGYTIRFEADRDIWVEADEGRILQVLYNLINNAVNYTGEDKTVVIRQTLVSPSTDAVETASANGEAIPMPEVQLDVIDTGVGIPSEELPLVWERYYKVHDFHKRANMGTGLGLSIVKNILLLHGAAFGVNSRVGEGSDFWFRLKTADEPKANE